MKKQSFKNSFIKKNNIVLWDGKYDRGAILKLAYHYEKAFRTSWSQAQKMAWNKARKEKKAKEHCTISPITTYPETGAKIVDLKSLHSNLNLEAVGMSIEYGFHVEKCRRIILDQWTRKNK